MKPIAYPRLVKLLAQKGIVLSGTSFIELINVLKSNPDAKVLDAFVARLAGRLNEIQPIPLEVLFSKLRIAGIEVDPATTLDIQKVLSTPGLIPKKLENVNMVLRPLICKSARQQAKFDVAFDDFLKEIKTFVKQQTKTSENHGVEILRAYSEDVRLRNRQYYWATGFLLVILITIRWIVSQEPDREKTSIAFRSTVIFPTEDSTRSYFIIGDSIRLDYTINAARKAETDERVYWVVNNDTTEGETHKLKLDSAGRLPVAALFFKNEKFVAQDVDTVSILCEKTPAVRIDRVSGNSLGEEITYKAIISNPSVDSLQYRYSWIVNDKEVSRAPTLDTFFLKPTAFSMQLGVTFPEGTHCSTKSLEDALTETIGNIPFSISGEDSVEYNSNAKLGDMTLAGAGLLLFSFGGYYLLLKALRIRHASREVPQEEGDEEPFTLKFKKQNTNIQVDKSITEIAANFNRRQQSEEFEFDVKQTVMRTVRAGGFPLVCYRDKTKKESFLFLIDSAIVTGHRQKLLEFLTDFLVRNQVELFCFTYFRHPVVMSNQNLKLDSVSLGYLNRNYRNSNLVFFSVADHFFSVEESTPFDWVTYVKTHWPSRTLITFTPEIDWDFKEAVLHTDGFTVVPNYLPSLMPALFQDIDSLQKGELSFYTSHLDLEDINQLEMFLGKDYLKQWVYALAIYPTPNWELTLAVGSKIEMYYPGNKPIVSYSNLEKLTRIGWLNDGIITDDLRGEMLKRLDSKIHKIARHTLHELFDQIKPDIKRNSIIWSEFQIHNTVNEFVLKGLENDRNYVQKNFQKIESLRNTGNLDAAVDVSINEKLPLYKEAIQSAKWKGFPEGYYSKLFIPLLISVALVLISMTQFDLKEMFVPEKSGTIKFILRSNVTDDSTLVDAALSIRLQDRTITPERVDQNTLFVKDLSRKEVEEAMTFRLNLRSGDSLVQGISPLYKTNYITLEEDATDNRLPVNVFYNNPDSVRDAEQVVRALEASQTFRLMQALQLNESIQRTTINATNIIAYKNLPQLVRENSSITSISSNLYGPRDTSLSNDRVSEIYLHYQKITPGPMIISKTSVILRQNGLEHKKFEISGGNMNTTIYVALIDQSVYSASILGITKSNRNGIRPAAIAEASNSNVNVILGSGFVKTFSPLAPNGFLKVNGEVVNNVESNGYNGIAGVRNGKLQLIQSKSSLTTLQGGFQTGPFLVRNGKNVYNSLQRSSNIRDNRAFIGINKSGRIIAAITEGPISLTELSSFLSTTTIPDLQCVTVLNLSGGGSEMLMVRSDKGEVNRYGSYDDYHSALIAFLEPGPAATGNVNQEENPPVSQNLVEEPTSADEYWKQALAAIEKLDNEQALILLRKALELDPENINYLTRLGDLTTSSREAVNMYERLLKLNPNSEPIKNKLGFTYLALPDYDKALDSFLKIYQANENTFNKMILGDVYRYTMDFKQAQNLHRQALQEVEDGRKENDRSIWVVNYMPTTDGDQRNIKENLQLVTYSEKKAVVLFAQALDNIFVGNLRNADQNLREALKVLDDKDDRYRRVLALFINRARACKLIKRGSSIENEKLDEMIDRLTELRQPKLEKK